MLLSDARTEYLYAKDYTPRSRGFFSSGIDAFLTWLSDQGVTTVDQLSLPLIRRYIDYHRHRITRYHQTMSSHTLHGQYEVVRVFLAFCIRECDADPRLLTRLLPIKVEETVIQPFTIEQVKQLLNAAKSLRDKALVSVLVDTGIRAEEACGLTKDRVTFRPDEARILVKGKGRRERELWLGQRSRLALHRYISREREDAVPYVFVTGWGNRFTHTTLHRTFLRIGREAGITNIRCSPHTCRHTFAMTYLSREGADVYKLSRLLGHSRIATTEVYLRAFNAKQARPSESILDGLL